MFTDLNLVFIRKKITCFLSILVLTTITPETEYNYFLNTID